MLIAQITDTHITPRGTIAHGRDAFAAFEQALAAVVSTDPRPDFILHTGDVTHHGDAALNREVRAALDATGIPYAVIPGNHDETEPLREAFADKPWMPKSGFIQFVIDDYPVRMICLDTKIPGEVAGTLCDERLAWLETQLKAGGARPTMLAMHHPAFRIGRPSSDAKPFRNAEGFAALVAKYPNVPLIAAGHVHCTLQARIGQSVAIAAPSTVYQFAMDRRPDNILCISGEPSGYYVHDWQDGVGFTSQYAPLGDFGKPVPLRKA